MKFTAKDFNIIAQCRAGGLGLWECPPFLFIIMGFVNVASIVATYEVALNAVEEPEYVALAALAVSTIIFIIGSAIVIGFNKVVEANRMKSDFIGIISHQLRSPLSIFKWTLNAFKEDIQKEARSEGTQMSITTLDETNQRMINLVNLFLEVNRIESSRLFLKKEQLSLEELTKKLIAGQKNYSDSQEITIELHSSCNEPINVDESKMQMVLQNLVDNAIRYSKKGGVITITIEKKGKDLLWKITDMGIGIPVEDQKNIFDKFFRAKNARTYQAEGNGIGLFIAKTMVRHHDGTIGFSSKEGEGSVFWFTVPIYSK